MEYPGGPDDPYEVEHFRWFRGAMILLKEPGKMTFSTVYRPKEAAEI
jgi:hypothetical protein